MFGIILWAALIIFIVICVDGWEFVGMLFLFGAVYLALYGLFYWIKKRYTARYKTRKDLRNHNNIHASEQEKGKTITPEPQTSSSTNYSNVNRDSALFWSANEIAQASQIDTNQASPVKKITKGIEDEERMQIAMGFNLNNILIDGILHKIEVIDKINESKYAITKLMKSRYPFSWDRLVKSEIRGNMLLIDYWLPSFEDMPHFTEIEYKNGHPICISPNDKRLRSVWSDVTYKITIRSLYELFSSTPLIGIESISFNGIIKSLDLATGNDSEKCILSIIANRSDFEKLDLSRIDAKQCFKRFKGISAHDLSTLTPIHPLLIMSKDDNRFSESYNVITNIEYGENLAAMNWRDFENFIRELFEKEFSADGSEVKITRASKDGGVDAVVFDPDPIRGGKIIIQAKRYTNVVGVSAVRDLYGTVMNEGATKGILVTTSDYGADSYNFAKDKPLSLLNGANLLYLLGKYGCQAHINIEEAKKHFNTTSDE